MPKFKLITNLQTCESKGEFGKTIKNRHLFPEKYKIGN